MDSHGDERVDDEAMGFIMRSKTRFTKIANIFFINWGTYNIISTVKKLHLQIKYITLIYV